MVQERRPPTDPISVFSAISAISAVIVVAHRPPTLSVMPVRTLIGSAGNPKAGS